MAEGAHSKGFKMKWQARLQVVAAAVTVLAVTTPLAWSSSLIEMGYVVELGGATIMKASYRTRIDDGQYETVLIGKTTGMSDMFSGYTMNIVADGTYTGSQFVPGSFENNRKKKSKKAKSTGVVWSADGNISIESAAGSAPVPAGVAKALSGSSTDPLTAVLRMANAQDKKPCSGKFRVYDGKDVYDLALSFSKNLKLVSASAESAGALECKLTSTPVAGRAVDQGETAIDSYGLVLAPFTTAARKEPFYLPVRITGRQKGIGVVVSAFGIRVDGEPVTAEISN
jgi:Protein of unknown function (DUF3108)